MIRPTNREMSFQKFLSWLKMNFKQPRLIKTLKGRTSFKCTISNDGRSLKIEYGSKSLSSTISQDKLVFIWKKYWDLGNRKYITSEYTDPKWPETPNRIIAPYVAALIRDFENDFITLPQEVISSHPTSKDKSDNGFYNPKEDFLHITKPTRDILYDEFYDPTDDFLLEPRAFCYDLATQLVNDAKGAAGENWYEDENTLQGVLLLLYTWNFAARETKRLNFKKVGELIRNSKDDLKFLENYTIITADDHAWNVIETVFDQFRNIFGQTGATKALSLLNPNLFVMWDTAIRKRLKKDLIPGIMNGEIGQYYVIFLKGIQNIIEKYDIIEKLPEETIIAKKIDEYHYVKIVMNKERGDPNEANDSNKKYVKITLPNNLRGRNIHNNVIPTVCNLKNMLLKLKELNGNVSMLKPWEKRSYSAYLIDKVEKKILNSPKDKWKDIIRDHILQGDPSDFGASCIDIYLVAYVAETVGAGKNNFFQYVKEKGISKKANSAQAIWQVGKGDGVFLGILHEDGKIKDVEFIKKWIGE